MIADLLNKIDAREKGPGAWSASCPVPGHGQGRGDRSRSLSVKQEPDGRILLHCFGGCSVEEILGAIGLDWDSLFPPKPIEHAKGLRRPFIPAQVFDIVRQEIGVAAICAADLHASKTVSPSDYERLFLCVERLDDIARSAYGR